MFSVFDITILTIISISSLLGIYKGLIRLSINLLGLIFSIIIAFYLYPFIWALLSKHLSTEIIITIASGVSSYIISLILTSLLTSKVNILISPISGNILDRFLGLSAGFVRGLVICVILFLIIAILSAGSYLKADNLYEVLNKTKPEQYPEWLKKSLTTKYLDSIIHKIPNIFEEETLKSIKVPKNSNTQNALDVIDNIDLNEPNKDECKFDNNDLNKELDEIIR
jgi:membrane protein required for colicin V production